MASAAMTRLQPDIDAYVQRGQHPGGFLYALLTNNLLGTITQADDESRAALPEILAYVINDIPQRCWGSEAAVKAWMREGDRIGKEELAEIG